MVEVKKKWGDYPSKEYERVKCVKNVIYKGYTYIVWFLRHNGKPVVIAGRRWVRGDFWITYVDFEREFNSVEEGNLFYMRLISTFERTYLKRKRCFRSHYSLDNLLKIEKELEAAW